MMFEPCGPTLVIGDAIGMLAAIDFHDEGGVGTVEIDNIGAARNLAFPPPAPKAAVAKGVPEVRLGVGVLAAKPSGSVPLRGVPYRADLGHGRMVGHG